MNLGNYIFVTGIYGSGKSTFVQNRRELLEGHTYLSFDHIYGYQARGERLDLVYTSLKKAKKSVMDALPLTQNTKSWTLFENFVSTSSCSIIIVYCDVDTWYTQHLPAKACFDTETEASHKEYFHSFYEHTGNRLLNAFPENTYIYRSDNDTLKKYERDELCWSF